MREDDDNFKTTSGSIEELCQRLRELRSLLLEQDKLKAQKIEAGTLQKDIGTRVEAIKSVTPKLGKAEFKALSSFISLDKSKVKSFCLSVVLATDCYCS